MDVTFHEFEPYYTKPWDLDLLLEELSSVTESDSREGESGSVQNEGEAQTRVIVGVIPCLVGVTETKEVVHPDNVVGMSSDDHEDEEVDENVEVIDNANEDVIFGTDIEERVTKEPIITEERGSRVRGSKSGVRGSKWVHHSHMILSLQSRISPRISLHPRPNMGQVVMFLISLNM
jgi:hypothetical protein